MRNEIKMKQILQEENAQKRNQEYQEYIKQVTPRHNCTKNILWAFLVGGAICLLGQVLSELYQGLGANKENASLYVTISLVALSVILTGLNWYPKLAKVGGAGTVVPITGFANSVAASALDYKVQGQVFGIGCFIFSIAGPVILYGIVSSWILGVIYWLITWMA